jgi:hypothetical protein
VVVGAVNVNVCVPQDAPAANEGTVRVPTVVSLRFTVIVVAADVEWPMLLILVVTVTVSPGLYVVLFVLSAEMLRSGGMLGVVMVSARVTTGELALSLDIPTSA